MAIETHCYNGKRRCVPMGINGGRSLRGIEESGFTRYNITLPPSLIERLDKFMKAEDRNRSWTIQQALDMYLKKKGY